MTSTTASFWGFSDKEVYYDRYLDLTKIYTDDFEDYTGITKSEYNYIKYFFAMQDAVNLYHPMDTDGLQAIVDLGAQGAISQNTINKVQNAINTNDLSQIDAEAIQELRAWSSEFSDLSLDITNTLSSIRKDLDAIVSPEESSSGDDESSEEVTGATIIASEAFTDFVASFPDGEYDEGQQLLISYLDAYVTEAYADVATVNVQSTADFFNEVAAGNIAVEEPAFYYVCSHLDSPNAITAEGSKISGISVPFLDDVKSYLAQNSWIDLINGLTSYSSLESYISGDKDLHNDQETLQADIATLGQYGIINKVKLVETDGVLVPSTVSTENIEGAIDQFITTNYQTDEGKVNAARHIGNLSQFDAIRAGTSDPSSSTYYVTYNDIFNNYNVRADQYLTVDAGARFDVSKYKEFKAAIGLADRLSMDAYDVMDQARKDKNVAKAQAALEEAQAALPEAQAAFDAVAQYENADPTSDEYKQYSKALDALRRVELAIQNAQNTIKNPDGILTKVNAKREYLFVGADNFRAIFGNTNRFNTVAGAFVTTAVMWVIGFIPQILLALLLSAWFTDTKLKLKGLGLMKALMYLPNVITAVTVAIFYRRLFSYSTGPATSAAQHFLDLIHHERYNFFESAWATRFIVCFINFWMWYGNTMIVLIAGITSINESLYESAQIDGANSFQTYTRITLPLLRPIVLYTLVTSMIGGLQMYDIPQNLNMNPALINFNGTMIRSTRTVLMYVNQQAFGKQDIKQVGIASAVSIILFVVTSILSIVIFYIMRDKDAAAAAKAKKLARKAGAGR